MAMATDTGIATSPNDRIDAMTQSGDDRDSSPEAAPYDPTMIAKRAKAPANHLIRWRSSEVPRRYRSTRVITPHPAPASRAATYRAWIAGASGPRASTPTGLP